ncbi:MAG: alpha/beta hydrolase, partial [Tyzzerella sp.]|nr:alpha/beta hydrolase [Tyzzerella sp.]
ELVIDGGFHAYFGMYGEQAGDGIPAISCEEQICSASEKMISWMIE